MRLVELHLKTSQIYDLFEYNFSLKKFLFFYNLSKKAYAVLLKKYIFGKLDTSLHSGDFSASSEYIQTCITIPFFCVIFCGLLLGCVQRWSVLLIWNCRHLEHMIYYIQIISLQKVYVFRNLSKTETLYTVSFLRNVWVKWAY